MGSGATHALEQVTSAQPGKCYRCGSRQHKARNCPHKDKQCNLCKKAGHLARVCKSGSTCKIIRNHQQAHTHQIEEATEEDEEDDDDHFGVHKVAGSKRYRKLVTRLIVGGTALEFEVDTGAELSTIPAALYHKTLTHIPMHHSSVVLRLYDGSVLPTKGVITVQVKQGSQTVTGSFVIVENVDNQLPLLGRDWLYHLRLDWPKLFHSGKYSDPRVHTVHVVKWINEFPEVTKEGLGLLKGIQADIELEPGAQPKFCKNRPIPFALKEQVEQLIWQQVKDGELEPVESSDWAAPIVIVKKKDGGIRICGDFKMTVNPQLRPKTYPLPTLDEVFAVLAQGESFSTIDLSRAYKQMEVAEGSRPFLTINTHMGLFRYRRLPFGIATAPAMGQRAMCIVLQGCRGVVYYIDDILVTGRSWKEHEENLQEVFRRLQQFGLKIKLEKCRFFEESVDYLGHTISCQGLAPTKERIASIVQAPAPSNKVELKSFLGLMTYNCRFLPCLSQVLNPLYQLVKREARWKWGMEQIGAFETAKELVAKAPVLAHYDVEL